MSIELENSLVKAAFSEKGAELISFKNKQADIEYIWQGDPAFWGRHAPVLFPIVGKLKNNQYAYHDKHYTMGQHGFARDSVFKVIEQENNHLCFELTDSETSLALFPFHFIFTIDYYLDKNSLKVVYRVHNPSTKEELYFSIGAHPGFSVPIKKDLTFDDYYLEFSPRKSRTCIPLNDGLIDYEKRTLAQTNTAIQLKHDWFSNDAQIFETKGTNQFSICTDKDEHKVTLTCEDFPYVGIWSTYPAEAPFVCVEPWFGLADTTDASGRLVDKLGIQKLAASETFTCQYSIQVV